MKNYIFLLIVFIQYYPSVAQTKIKEAYEEYTINRTSPPSQQSLDNAKYLLANKGELTTTQVTNVVFNIGSLYEKLGDLDSAEVYYLESLKSAPNYFVTHRALGFIYLEQSKKFINQVVVANSEKNVNANELAWQQFKEITLKAIKYIEKSYACDPDEETLALLMERYKSVKISLTLDELEKRLIPLRKNCVDLLDD